MTPLEKLLLELCKAETWGGVGKWNAMGVIRSYASRIEADVMKGFIKYLEGETALNKNDIKFNLRLGGDPQNPFQSLRKGRNK